MQMGRHIRFSTDLEYKFGVGIQPTNHAGCFGGKLLMRWTQEDKPLCLAELRTLPFAFPDFEAYEFSVDGTELLRADLYAHRQWKETEASYKFMLGCLIYHQLCYVRTLEGYVDLY